MAAEGGGSAGDQYGKDDQSASARDKCSGAGGGGGNACSQPGEETEQVADGLQRLQIAVDRPHERLFLFRHMRTIWQAEFDGGKWQDVDEAWLPGLTQACEQGKPEIRLEHLYKNRRGETTHSWYTIDLRDHENVTQLNEASHKKRKMRAVCTSKLARRPRTTPTIAAPSEQSAVPSAEQPVCARLSALRL